eukprot:SAG31_NODE_7386_length_1703_cov_1.809227_2_plen_325_part_00
MILDAPGCERRCGGGTRSMLTRSTAALARKHADAHADAHADVTLRHLGTQPVARRGGSAQLGVLRSGSAQWLGAMEQHERMKRRRASSPKSPLASASSPATESWLDYEALEGVILPPAPSDPETDEEDETSEQEFQDETDEEDGSSEQELQDRIDEEDRGRAIDTVPINELVAAFKLAGYTTADMQGLSAVAGENVVTCLQRHAKDLNVDPRQKVSSQRLSRWQLSFDDGHTFGLYGAKTTWERINQLLETVDFHGGGEEGIEFVQLECGLYCPKLRLFLIRDCRTGKDGQDIKFVMRGYKHEGSETRSSSYQAQKSPRCLRGA